MFCFRLNKTWNMGPVFHLLGLWVRAIECWNGRFMANNATYCTMRSRDSGCRQKILHNFLSMFWRQPLLRERTVQHVAWFVIWIIFIIFFIFQTIYSILRFFVGVAPKNQSWMRPFWRESIALIFPSLACIFCRPAVSEWMCRCLKIVQ